MSFNQFRSDKASDSQYTKSGNRSGNTAASYQRTNSVKSSGGGGPAPPRSLQSSCSFKKTNHVQGGPSRVGAPSMNPELTNAPAPTRNAQNGVHQQAPYREMADGPARTAAARITELPSTPSSNPADPKILPLQSVSGSSNPKLMQTPPKTEGGPPRGFSLQFGSISPGFVNGMQIPPRTTSAPPNLDEQKCDQARVEFSRPVPSVPIPSVPKQQLAVKESNDAKQKHPLVAVSNPLPDMKKETHAPSQAPLSLPQKPSAVRVSGMPMPVPFHQPHGPLQFGVPLQLQPQVVPSTSLQMPPILSAGSSPLLQQPMFIPAIQPLPMQHHGIMHQGQGMNFTNQLRPQLSHQIGSRGINIGPQFTPPQAGEFNSPRRAVKITHPDTRKELRLDRREVGIAGEPPKSGIHTGVLPQPQPVPSLRPAHPNNYYSSSFSSPYYSPASVVPSIQITLNPQTAKANHSNNQSHRNPILGNAEHFNLETRNIPTTISSTTPTVKEASSKMESVTAKVADVVYHSGSSIMKLVHATNVTVDSAMVGSKISTGRIDAIASARSPTSTNTEATPTYDVSTATISDNEASTNESLSRSRSMKDQQKKPSDIEKFRSQPQVGGKTTAAATLPLNDGPPRISEGTTIIAPSGVIEALSTHSTSPDASESPKHSVPANTLNGESKERVEYLQSKVSKQTSIDMKEETKDGIMGTNNSITIEVEQLERESKKSLTLSVGVEFSKTDEVDLVPSAVFTGNHDTTSDESDLSNTVLELKDTTSLSVAASNDRAPLEMSRPKSATAKGRRQKKELLQKADAAGSTSDLYTAYKGPENKELTLSTESSESGSGCIDLKKLLADTKEGIKAGKSEAQVKSEPENWEDAEDIMAPKLDIADKRKSSSIGSTHDVNEMRKYSKDFLMKFKDQCNILPEDFHVPSDVLCVLLASSVNLSNRDSYPSPGRGADRSSGGARSDRRENLPVGDDKWNKGPGPFPSRDQRADVGYGNTMGGFRPGSGGNSGVLRYPRGQVPGHHPGGILSRPLQPLNTSQRDNADADRWQRGTNFQKGLLPSPQTPAQMMHKAEKKYERGKVADEGQAKQRQLKGSNDRAPLEMSRPKSATAKGKRQKKGLLQKADAARSTSDLYTAYKGPEYKKLTLSTESSEGGSGCIDLKKLPADTKEGIKAGRSEAQVKSEPENREDAEDIRGEGSKTATAKASASASSFTSLFARGKEVAMGVLSNKVERDLIKPGDHIYSWRSAYIYAHHGIYAGDGKVIHFTRGAGQEIGTGTALDKFIFSSLPSQNPDNPCPNCGDQSRLDDVICSCLDCFLAGGDLYLFEYDVKVAYFLAKSRGGTCTLEKSDPPGAALHRASFLLENGFGVYHIFKNNCEDFAIYCKTGLLVNTNIFSVGRSGQAASLLALATTVMSSPLRFLTTNLGGLAVVGNFGGLAVVGAGMYCVSRLASDMGVRGDVVKVPVETLVKSFGTRRR